MADLFNDDKTLRETFADIAKTIDSNGLTARQCEDGTILPEPDGSSEAFERLIQSLPRIPIEGNCEGPHELKIGETLGEGGMGIVRLAKQLSIGRPVAVKTLRDSENEKHHIINLLREAWLTGTLEHPGIVPVHVLGRDHQDLPVFVMKRIQGTSWKRLMAEGDHLLIRRSGKEPLVWHLEVLMDVCEAVRTRRGYGAYKRG